jgi:hypothetical protein
MGGIHCHTQDPTGSCQGAAALAGARYNPNRTPFTPATMTVPSVAALASRVPSADRATAVTEPWCRYRFLNPCSPGPRYLTTPVLGHPRTTAPRRSTSPQSSMTTGHRARDLGANGRPAKFWPDVHVNGPRNLYPGPSKTTWQHLAVVPWTCSAATGFPKPAHTLPSPPTRGPSVRRHQLSRSTSLEEPSVRCTRRMPLDPMVYANQGHRNAGLPIVVNLRPPFHTSSPRSKLQTTMRP